MDKEALAEFVGKFKDALLSATGKGITVLPSIRPAYAKYYVCQKLFELGARDIRVEVQHPVNGSVRVDLLVFVRDYPEAVNVRIFDEKEFTYFTKAQLEWMDYLVVLISTEGSPDFKHQYVFTKAELQEINERGPVEVVHNRSQYPLHLYDTVAEYEAKVKAEKQTRIEWRIIAYPEDFEQKWEKIVPSEG